MQIRTWPEIERILRRQGKSSDEIFDLKSRYYDRVVLTLGRDPEDEDTRLKRDVFLYGNNKDWEIIRAAKKGLMGGIGEIPETLADIIETGQRLIPGESSTANDAEQRLRDLAQSARDAGGDFRPSSIAEGVASSVGALPGAITSMAPLLAGATAAVAASPIAGTTAAMFAAPALGIGAYEAIRNVRGGPLEMAKGAAKGAALGTILGGARRATVGFTGELAGRLAHGAITGGGAAGLELATGADRDQVIETGITMGALGMLSGPLGAKLAGTARANGITDPADIEAFVKERIGVSLASPGRKISRKKKALEPKTGTYGPEEPEKVDLTTTIRASELSEKTNVPFESLTGSKPWISRFVRTRNESKSLKTKAQWQFEKGQAMKAIGQRKADYLAGNIRIRGGPGRISTDDAKQWWYKKFENTAKEYDARIAEAPETPPPKIGAEYTLFDESGENALYKVDRVDFDTRSPVQFRVRSLTDKYIQPRYFRTLTEAENALKREVLYDPEISLGGALAGGYRLMESPVAAVRAAGRNIVYDMSRRLNMKGTEMAVKPFSAADAADMIEKRTKGSIIEGFTGPGDPRNPEVTGSHRPEYNQTRVTSKLNLDLVMHEFGHRVHTEILRHVFPNITNAQMKDAYLDVSADGKPGPLRIMFPELPERLILDELGKDYSSIDSFNGEVEIKKPAKYSSYIAEGVAEYYRRQSTGRPLTEGFYTEQGRKLQEKLDGYVRGDNPVPGLASEIDDVGGIYQRFSQQLPGSKVLSTTSDGKTKYLSTHQSRMGETIYQWVFNQVQPSIDTFKKVWKATKGENASIPDIDNIEYMYQLYPSSATAQQAAGSIETGVFPDTSFGMDIKIESLPSAMARSKLTTKVRSRETRGNLISQYRFSQQLKNVTEYLFTEKYAAFQDYIDFYQESLKNPGGDHPVYGKLATKGELLSHKSSVDAIRERFGSHLGKEVQAHRDTLRKKYPDAIALVDWLDEFEAAKRVAASPSRAGGSGLAEFKNVLANLQLKKDPESETGMRMLPYLRDRVRLPLYQEVMDYSIGDKSIQKLDFGGERKFADALTAIGRSLEDNLTEVAHNRIMNSYKFMIANQGKANLNIGQVLDDETVQSGLRTGAYDKVRDRLVSFRSNGYKQWIKFSETPEGIKNWKSIKHGGQLFVGHKILDTVIGGPKRMMVLGTTGANLGFLLITNPQRDTLTRSIQSAIETTPGSRARSGLGFKGAFYTLTDTLPFLFRANLNLFNMGTDLALQKAKGDYKTKLESYTRYISSPVKGSTLIGADIKSRTARNDELLLKALNIARKNKGSAEDVIARYGLVQFTVKHPIEWIRRMMNISEDLNRYPEFLNTEIKLGEEYYAARKAKYDQIRNTPEWNSLSKEEQVGFEQEISAGPQPRGGIRSYRNAAEVSIDFKRAGIIGRVLNEMIPFFNPSLQGVDKFNRVLFNDKPASLKNLNGRAIAAAAQVVTAPTLFFWAMNKDEEWYKELPNWEKLLFWHARVGKTVYKMPVPFEWGMLAGTLPVMVMDSIYNDAPERIKQQMSIALKSIVPYDFMLEVQTLKPVIEGIANKNFFTSIPIESETMKRREPSERYRPETLGIFKKTGKLAKLLNAPEMLQSPVMLEHLTRGYFGSVVYDLLDTLEGPSTAGLAGRLVTNTKRPGQSVADFYEYMDKEDQAWNTVVRRIQDEDPSTAAKILFKHRKAWGLDAEMIRNIVRMRDPDTPPGLLKIHQASRRMAASRKEKEDEEMTEIAQAILGRDWE